MNNVLIDKCDLVDLLTAYEYLKAGCIEEMKPTDLSQRIRDQISSVEKYQPVAYTSADFLESIEAGNIESIWPKNYEDHQFFWSPSDIPLFAYRPSECDGQHEVDGVLRGAVEALGQIAAMPRRYHPNGEPLHINDAITIAERALSALE